MPADLARAALVLAAVAPLGACQDDAPAGARDDRFTWRGRVPADGWVRIRDVNGAVRVARAGAGDEVVIVATKVYRGRAPEPVRLVAEPDARGVTACALWGAGGGRCAADGYRGSSERGWFDALFRRRAAVRVDYLVAVPAGVRIDARTTNGAIVVADATRDVVARTTNGDVTLGASGGPVDARTVNGEVRALLGPLAPAAGVSLRTVNGSVRAALPAPLDAEVTLKTVNGTASSDHPLPAATRGRRERHGVLGAGGRRVVLASVNGSVALERR